MSVRLGGQSIWLPSWKLQPQLQLLHSLKKPGGRNLPTWLQPWHPRLLPGLTAMALRWRHPAVWCCHDRCRSAPGDRNACWSKGPGNDPIQCLTPLSPTSGTLANKCVLTPSVYGLIWDSFKVFDIDVLQHQSISRSQFQAGLKTHLSRLAFHWFPLRTIEEIELNWTELTFHCSFQGTTYKNRFWLLCCILAVWTLCDCYLYCV